MVLRLWLKHPCTTPTSISVDSALYIQGTLLSALTLNVGIGYKSRHAQLSTVDVIPRYTGLKIFHRFVVSSCLRAESVSVQISEKH